MDSKLPDASLNDKIRQLGRISYSSPHLVKYGKLSDITLNVAKLSGPDGASNGNGKNFTR